MWKRCFDKYAVNDKGDMKNIKTGRKLKVKESPKGYLSYGISIEGKYRDVSAHRLVAKNFIPNELNKEVVNHIDGNKRNNNVRNLEWVTHSENTKHAFETGLSNNSHRKLPVFQLDKQGNIIKEFDTLTEASEYIGGYKSHISGCCRGKRKTHKGYKWRYKLEH